MQIIVPVFITFHIYFITTHRSCFFYGVEYTQGGYYENNRKYSYGLSDNKTIC